MSPGPDGAASRALAEPNDLFLAATFLAADFAAGILPAQRWYGFSQRFATLSMAVRRMRVQADARQLEPYLSALYPHDPSGRSGIRAMIAASFEERIFFRKAARDPAWRPEIRLEGREALDAAVAAGRGAVLWVVPVAFATLVVKMALFDAGYRVAHLSRTGHGGGRSRIGFSLINELQNAVEERFVERVVMSQARAPTAALRELKRRLEAKSVVSVTGVDLSDNPIELPFLYGRLRFATGAPRLAALHRSPLLAAITTRDERNAFRICLELLPTAEPVANGARRSHAVIEQQTRAFREAYEHAVQESPALLRRGQSAFRVDADV